MYSKNFVSAVATLGMVTGTIAIGCNDPTVTINSAADASQVAACGPSPIKGSVVIAPGVADTVDLSGQLTEIQGDLSVENNGALLGLKSSSLRSIGGSFKLNNVTKLSSLSFSALSTVGDINWATLTALPQIDFGTVGVTSAKSVVVQDTLLNTLIGINVQTVDQLNINNNKRLTQFSSSIRNLTTLMNINANGLNLTVDLPNLQWAANLTISNVTSFSAPSLGAINGSIRLDSNSMQTFSAPNLTEVQTGDLSFVSNSQVTNISFPLLKTVGGGFTVANNSALQDLSSFPALELVGGAVLLRGAFKSVDTPALKDVRGAFDLASTQDITNSCNNFQKLKNTGEISGNYNCSSKDDTANNSTSASDGGSGKGGNSNSSAMSVYGTSNMSWIVSLVSIAGFVVAFL